MTVHMRPYIKDDIELDQIAVQGIRVEGYHGVLDTERESGQLFFADVVAHVNSRTAAARDNVSHAVNYSDMADRAAEVLAGSPNQLIEAVAELIARAVLEMEGVECVDVTVHKPHAPLHVEFKDVTVTIRRDLNDGNLWADKRIGSSAGASDDPMDTGTNPVRDDMDVRPLQPVGAVIALGGNLGDVEPTFRTALSELHRVSGVEVHSASPLVRTAPEGGVDQPDYLNAVVRVSTALSPRELLAACHGIEMLHGRDRVVPGAARTLDLDLISYDGVTGETADLTLPHPRAHQRAFVLLPWSHMEPEAVLEPHGAVADLARTVGLEGVRMVSTDWPHVPAPDALAGPSVAPAPSASVQQPTSAGSPLSAQSSAAAPESAGEEVPAQLSPYIPAPAAQSEPAAEPSSAQASAPSSVPESAPFPEPDSAPFPEPDSVSGSGLAASEPAPTPTWAPVQQSAPGSAAAPSEQSAPVQEPAPAQDSAPDQPSAARPTSLQDVPSFPAPSVQSQGQPPALSDPQSTADPQPQASESADSSADRPDSAGPQTGVPRRTSFGVARQHAESPDETS